MVKGQSITLFDDFHELHIRATVTVIRKNKYEYKIEEVLDPENALSENYVKACTGMTMVRKI